MLLAAPSRRNVGVFRHVFFAFMAFPRSFTGRSRRLRCAGRGGDVASTGRAGRLTRAEGAMAHDYTATFTVRSDITIYDMMKRYHSSLLKSTTMRVRGGSEVRVAPSGEILRRHRGSVGSVRCRYGYRCETTAGVGESWYGQRCSESLGDVGRNDLRTSILAECEKTTGERRTGASRGKVVRRCVRTDTRSQKSDAACGFAG